MARSSDASRAPMAENTRMKFAAMLALCAFKA
jgi:hypothetical protein